MAGLFCSYLDYCRSTIELKLTGLSVDQLATPVLPSGWTPLGLLKHLVHMERRWFVWGVEGEPVDHPWNDSADGAGGGGWSVEATESLDGLLLALHEGGARTSEIIRRGPLTRAAATGGRFASDPPSVLWVCFHVLQEYARHAGHLDVVRELLDAQTGE